MGLVVQMSMVGFFKTQTLDNDENWAFGNNPGWDLQTRHNFQKLGEKWPTLIETSSPF